MSNTEIKNKWLDAQSLGMIIDKCGKNGVRELTLSEKECVIKFGQEPQELPVISQQHDLFPVKDEVTEKAGQMDQMLIEDPAGYERQIFEGETDAET